MACQTATCATHAARCNSPITQSPATLHTAAQIILSTEVWPAMQPLALAVCLAKCNLRYYTTLSYLNCKTQTTTPSPGLLLSHVHRSAQLVTTLSIPYSTVLVRPQLPCSCRQHVNRDSTTAPHDALSPSNSASGIQASECKNTHCTEQPGCRCTMHARHVIKHQAMHLYSPVALMLSYSSCHPCASPLTSSLSCWVSMGGQTLKYRRCRLGMGTRVGRPRPGTRVSGSAASFGSRLGSRRATAFCAHSQSTE